MYDKYLSNINFFDNFKEFYLNKFEMYKMQ